MTITYTKPVFKTVCKNGSLKLGGHLNLFDVNDNLIKLNHKQCTTQENH